MNLSLRAIAIPTAAGLIVWAAVTMFFRWFGHLILTSVHDERFPVIFIGLEGATGIGLYLIGLLYRKIDRSPRALLRFALIGSAVGLMLDSVSLSCHPLFFPGMNRDQVLAFTVWMAFAYGLFLIIPALQNALALTTGKR
ncbi:hypothetical protein [Brevibacillus thermoruber]|uniref:hypothetical protein n=1 Tax=Brevibacillus thermoruber TaxID=33942 RepID=UPI00068CBF76|nr:hypothetical protein [Brevibacillus thermoruber]